MGKVYVLRSSSDGNLGVYGNVEAAFKTAMTCFTEGQVRVFNRLVYVKGHPEINPEEPTLKACKKHIKESGYYDIEDFEDEHKVEIQAFELER